MISIGLLAQVIAEQNENFLQKQLISREMAIPIPSNQILVVSGVRRCGKSVLIRKSLPNDAPGLYLNFEDPRLVDFEAADFPKLAQLRDELGKKSILLDEVQTVVGWEIFARSLHEKGEKLYITGSNASMLSRELGTRLTGRYKQVELFPFSYTEFLTQTTYEHSSETSSHATWPSEETSATKQPLSGWAYSFLPTSPNPSATLESGVCLRSNPYAQSSTTAITWPRATYLI